MSHFPLNFFLDVTVKDWNWERFIFNYHFFFWGRGIFFSKRMSLKLKKKIIWSYFPLLWPRRSDLTTGSGWRRWWTWGGRPILCKTHDFWCKCWGWEQITSNLENLHKLWSFIFLFQRKKKKDHLKSLFFTLSQNDHGFNVLCYSKRTQNSDQWL